MHCDEYVCLSVCLLAYRRNHTAELRYFLVALQRMTQFTVAATSHGALSSDESIGQLK